MKALLPDAIHVDFYPNVDKPGLYTIIYKEYFKIKPETKGLATLDDLKKLVELTAGLVQLNLPDCLVEWGIVDTNNGVWIELSNEAITRERAGNMMTGEFLAWGTIGTMTIAELLIELSVRRAEKRELAEALNYMGDVLDEMRLKVPGAKE